MGKVTYRGPVPADDPMFTEGGRLFTSVPPRKLNKPAPESEDRAATKRSRGRSGRAQAKAVTKKDAAPRRR
jgi:hypothetical protein